MKSAGRKVTAHLFLNIQILSTNTVKYLACKRFFFFIPKAEAIMGSEILILVILG